MIPLSINTSNSIRLLALSISPTSFHTLTFIHFPSGHLQIPKYMGYSVHATVVIYLSISAGLSRQIVIRSFSVVKAMPVHLFYDITNSFVFVNPTFASDANELGPIACSRLSIPSFNDTFIGQRRFYRCTCGYLLVQMQTSSLQHFIETTA